MRTVDKEWSTQHRATYELDPGWVQSLESSLRPANHKRDGPRLGPAFHSGFPFDSAGKVTSATPIPTSGWVGYPGDFGDGLGGGFWDKTGFT